MSTDAAVKGTTNKIKVNWINESIAGAILSTAFTTMAAHSGANGVEADSLAQHLHDLVIVGGTAMAVICSLTAILLIGISALRIAARKAAAMFSYGFGPAGNLQTVKLLKIFLP